MTAKTLNTADKWSQPAGTRAEIHTVMRKHTQVGMGGDPQEQV